MNAERIFVELLKSSFLKFFLREDIHRTLSHVGLLIHGNYSFLSFLQIL